MLAIAAVVLGADPALAGEAADAPLDPSLFSFLLIGGGAICLIAVGATNNTLVRGYARARKYTEEPHIFPPRSGRLAAGGFHDGRRFNRDA